MSEKVAQHPNLVTWIVLAFGMLVILFWSARDVSLTMGQRGWLALATVVLAGLCAWIISWEADDDGVESGLESDSGLEADSGPESDSSSEPE